MGAPLDRMVKALRIVAGLILVAVLLYAAPWSTRDCSTVTYSSDNCLWLRVRERLGLPPSRVGRALALELVGLSILGGLYLTVRYVFPRSPGSRAHSAVENRAPHANPRGRCKS